MKNLQNGSCPDSENVPENGPENGRLHGGICRGANGRLHPVINAEGLTPLQEDFVQTYVRVGGSVGLTCDAIGISASSGRRLLRLPLVKTAIQTALDLSLRTEGASLAWGCIRGLLTDAGTPANVRFAAARWTLEHSGLGLSAQTLAHAHSSPHYARLADLSEVELQAIVEAGVQDGVQTGGPDSPSIAPVICP